MLVLGRLDGQARPDAHACCYAVRLLLLLLRPTPPAVVDAPVHESMCVGPPSYMPQRGNTAHTLIREREKCTRAPIRERPLAACEREES
jgi:hypothetical protein